MAGPTERFFQGCLAVLIALAIAPPLAWGDEDDDAEARVRAKALLDRGDEHLRRGSALEQRGQADRATAEFERALEAYQEAFDAFPESRIYYPIARAEEQLGRYLDAHRHYQLVLDEVEALSDRLRAEVELRQETVREQIAGLRIEVDPEGAAISIDGDEAGRGPFDAPIFVEAGEHTIEISAEGHRSRRFELNASEGDEVQIYVALEPTPQLGDDTAARQPRVVAAEPSAPSRAPLIAGVSATAGLGVAATVTGLMAVSKHGTFTDETRPSDERQAARDAGQILAVATDVLVVATVAAAGYTAYYYYADYRPGRQARGAEARGGGRAVWVAPYAADDGGGLALGGRF